MRCVGVRVFGVVVLLGLAACGGGGGSGATPPVHAGGPTSVPTATPASGTPAPAGSPGAGLASAVVTIDWGGVTQSVAQAGHAKPSFISPSAMGINLYVAQGGGTPVLKAALQRPTSTASITLPIGANTFYAASYDAWDSVNLKGTGTLLGVSSAGSQITIAAPPATNNVTVTVNPIVGGVKFSTSGVHDGTAGTVSIPVNALDPDGNVISGSAGYANGPIVVAFSDNFASFSGFPSAQPTIGAPGGSVSLTFDGANDCSASLTGTAPAYTLPSWLGTGTTGGANVVQSIDPAGGSSSYANPWFGRLTVCWQPLSGATAYNVYRGTSAGGESATAYATFSSSGALGMQDYAVLNGQNYYYIVCTGALGSTCSSEFSATPNGDPTTIGTAPTYWFDANDTSTVTGSTWKDKSPNHNNLTIGKGLTLTGNAFNIVGRSAVVSSSGSYAYTASGTVSTPLTVFAVAAQSGSNGSQYQRLINLGNGADNRGFVGTWAGSTSAYPGDAAAFWGNSATSGYGNCNGWCDTHANGPLSSWAWNLSPTANLPSLLDVVNDGSCPTYICGPGSGQGGPLSYFNGAAMNQDHNGTMTSTTGLEIGAYGGSNTTQYWNGTIGEIVIYPAVLTTTQRQQLEGYLACKWGFQSALPAAHPYAAGKQCP